MQTTRNLALALLSTLSLLAAACGGGGGGNQADLLTSAGDMAKAAQPMLTVNNTLSWCDITVTVGTAAPVTFGTASKTFAADEGTVVKLSATPHTGFIDVKWTGTTSATGDTTYTVTAASAQMVTGCCPFADGHGC